MNTQQGSDAGAYNTLEVQEPAPGWLARVAVAEIGVRIKTAREAANLTQEQLAKAIGVHTNTIGKVERGTAVPDAQLLLDLGPAIKVTPQWLLVGDTSKAGAGVPVICENLVLIPDYSVQASAGNGLNVNEEDIIGTFAMPRSWLARKGLNPATLVVVHARGDSMEPTVRDGDILVVDRKVTRLAGDGIYLIERENDLYCKRLQKLFDGGVIIKSDNQQRYDPQQLLADAASALNIIGRVIWIGGER